MSSAIAVSIVPGELRLLVARGNGTVKPLHQLAAKLPPDAVRAGLRAPNVADAEAVTRALSRLAQEAKVATQRRGMVAVLVPDAAVRVALTPVEGAEPGRAEGEAMARWALEDLLSGENGAARIDWSIVREQRADPAPAFLLAIGADRGVVREYEGVVESLGWIPGRVIPLTLALAVGAAAAQEEEQGREAAQENDPQAGAAARIVLSGIGGRVACLVEAAGVPRFHRAWRGIPSDIVAELSSVQRYVDQRLGLEIGAAALAGPDGWRKRLADDCEALGWRTQQLSDWSAHLGAVQP